MYMKMKNKTLPTSQMKPGMNSSASKGGRQPPKKSEAMTADTTTMLTYSPNMKMPQRMPVYSVMWPATNSCSASARSKGARLSSAMLATKKMTKPTICGMKNQSQKFPACASTMSTKFTEPAMTKSPTSAMPMLSS